MNVRIPAPGGWSRPVVAQGGTGGNVVVDHREIAEMAVARARVTKDALIRMVALVVKIGGYMKPEDQQALRDAQALLVELGK